MMDPYQVGMQMTTIYPAIVPATMNPDYIWDSLHTLARVLTTRDLIDPCYLPLRNQVERQRERKREKREARVRQSLS